MTAAADYLREFRRSDLERADRRDAEADELEKQAATKREAATTLRLRATETKNAILTLEGPDAKVDLPEGMARPSGLDVL